MDPLFQDERISAYLDGELPPDERSQFEDELARNGELRQVVEELRGLHDSLQALPQHRLNDDFAEQVLRRAERTMLADSHAVANGPNGSAAEDSHVVRAAASSSISEARTSRRPWIWAAVAIAVAVFLMVLNPPPKKHVELAQSDAAPRANAPQRDKSNEMLPEGQLSAPAAGSVAKRLGDPRLLAKESSSSGAIGEKDGLRSIGGDLGANAAPQDGVAPAAGFGGRREEAKAVLPAPMHAATPPAAPAEKAADALAGGRLTPQSNVESRQNGLRSADAPSNPSAEGKFAGQPQFFGRTVVRSAAKGAAADATNLDKTAHGEANGGAANRGQSLQAGSFSAVPGEHAHGSSPAGDMILAEYATTAEVSPATLQRLLDKRGITLNESPAANLALLSAVRSASPAVALKLADSDRSAQASAADEEPLEVVYVVGTREQVMGLVDDLHSQPAQYRSLAVANVTPEAADGSEKDAGANGKRSALTDHAGKSATDENSSGERLGAAVRKEAQVFAPAAPQPLVPAAAPHAAAPGQSVRPQDAKLDEKPGAEPALAAADSEASAEPTERANGSGWATRMMSLPPETENVLRQSLAQRENQPVNRNRQLEEQKKPGAGQRSAELHQDKDADKAKSDAAWKQQAGNREGLARLDGGAAGDQVQAVLVFRLVPGKANPTTAAPPAAVPAAATPGKAAK